SERRSTPRFEKELYFFICHLDFIDIIVFQQHETNFYSSSSSFLSEKSKSEIELFHVPTV
ncbi:hypothetical protein, partial [Lysinibacillus sp. NPDC096215]|uniref:hypothetical protein n=1 Tax=Lysinibacillus sp. NPDC096215 TaxID=3390582 RepID=UPI003D07068C